MKKGTRKCLECGKWTPPVSSTYYRGKRGRVTFIKQRKEILYSPRRGCIHCGKRFNKS